VKLKRNPNCPLCGDNPTVTQLIDYEVFCGLASPAQVAGVH
jgi:adenylyltransferase/sulfurtransferase